VRRQEGGFTLIELVLAMTLLAAMMALLWGGLTFAIRAWDAGELYGRRTVDLRIAENFLRREMTEIFPMRFKEATILKFAFAGETRKLRFVSARPAGISEGGLALVGWCGTAIALAGARAAGVAVPAAAPGTRPDLTGLSCRWNDIPASHGLILSLVVAMGR